MSSNTEHHINLSDGRVLSYAEYGSPKGFPVLYFHGGQESRLSSKFLQRDAELLNIRLIAPERPGIGNSSYQTGRSFLNWANDIEELTDQLSIETFSVFGLSGGSPHVLAVVSQLNNRIGKSAIVAGAAPYNYKGSLKGMWFPVKVLHWLAALKKDKHLCNALRSDLKGLKNPEKRLQQFQKHLPKPDKELMLQKPELGIEFIKGSLESYRQGLDGVSQEWRLYVRDWGIDFKKINQSITLWYGTDDKMAPPQRGHYLNKILPKSELIILRNEAHFSLIRNHSYKILTSLILK